VHLKDRYKHSGTIVKVTADLGYHPDEPGRPGWR
jgi:hypothetical protein